MSDETRSPVVAFGLFALACAVRAKGPGLRDEDPAELRDKAAQWFPHREDVREAVEAFLEVADPAAELEARRGAANALLATLAQLHEGFALLPAQGRDLGEALGDLLEESTWGTHG